MKKYEIYGKEYDVTGYVQLVNNNKQIVGGIPIVDIPMTSDYKWQLECLAERINKPEVYRKIEDTKAVIEKLKTWIKEKTTVELYQKYCEKYPQCYDLCFKTK